MCKDGKSFIPFQSESYFSTVEEYAFYPVSDWMFSFSDIRASMRLLSEQGDGLDISPAIRTATARFDTNASGGLNDWTAVGTGTSTEGDSDPQDIDISAAVSGESWLQLGFAVKKASGAGAIGQGQAAVQYNLPTERTQTVAGPVNLDTVTTPVGDTWAELFATGWMSYYDLQSITIPYEIYDANNYSYKFVLQAVKTDPSKEAPVEDDILAATNTVEAAQVTASTFNNADNIKAQFFRVVFMAKQDAGTSEGTARAWFAVGAKYA